MQVHVWFGLVWIAIQRRLNIHIIAQHNVYFVSNKYSFQNNNSNSSSSTQNKMCSLLENVSHFNEVEGDKPTTAWHLTRQLAILEKYEISFKRKLFRVSVYVCACLSSVNSFKQSTLFFSRRLSHSSIHCDCIKLIYMCDVCGALHADSIQSACLHTYIFVSIRYISLLLFFLLLLFQFIDLQEWYYAHLHLLVNQWQAHILKNEKLICEHSIL